MRWLLILVCTLVWLAFGANVSSQLTQPSSSATDPTIEAKRLALDRERFVFDQQKYERDRSLELWKTIATVLSLGVPLTGAVVAYMFQARSQRQQEALQFQLKAAEIVMEARDTHQVTRKAKLLTTLFPGRLCELEAALQRQQYPYFGRSQEAREELLKLLAQYPESRSDIIRAWGLIFPWDTASSEWSTKSEQEKSAYRWFDELKQDMTLNRNRPPPEPPRVPS